MNENRVSVNTVIRTVVLALTLINQALTASGRNPLPFAEDTVYEMLTALATIIVSVWAWWQNNSFTKEAIEADRYLDELKGEKK